MKTNRKIIPVFVMVLLVGTAAFGDGIELPVPEKKSMNEASPALTRFREAQGFKEKVEAIITGIAEGARENSERQKARLEEIQNRYSYKNILERQRNNRTNAADLSDKKSE